MLKTHFKRREYSLYLTLLKYLRMVRTKQDEAHTSHAFSSDQVSPLTAAASIPISLKLLTWSACNTFSGERMKALCFLFLSRGSMNWMVFLSPVPAINYHTIQVEVGGLRNIQLPSTSRGTKSFFELLCHEGPIFL
jgi:hypothetical protein